MRNAQVSFSQTHMATLEKNASFSEKYNFRGICFILSLRWLDLKSTGKSDADSIMGLKDQGRFLALWRDFNTQRQMASKLKETIKKEIALNKQQAKAFDVPISTTKASIKELTWDQIEEHVLALEVLESLRQTRRDLRAQAKGGQEQLSRMFASARDRTLANGEVGTSSEQILRRMFSMNIKMVNVEKLTIKSTSMFLGDTLSWTEAGSAVENFVSALATGGASLFEIGLYGSGAHSVAVHADGTGAYSFFDPNYGVFVGDGTLNKLGVDVANLLKDKYPKMNKVVITLLEIS